MLIHTKACFLCKYFKCFAYVLCGPSKTQQKWVMCNVWTLHVWVHTLHKTHFSCSQSIFIEAIADVKMIKNTQCFTWIWDIHEPSSTSIHYTMLKNDAFWRGIYAFRKGSQNSRAWIVSRSKWFTAFHAKNAIKTDDV